MATLLEISNRTLRVPTTPFKNEPLTDFSTAENARNMKAALTKVRAALLHTVAGIRRERKFEFAAWMVYEVGKNWAEADADIAETIDFAEFYSREALRLAQAKTPTQLPGEADRLIYIPLGVAAVI